MAHLTSVKVAEISMTRRDPRPISSLIQQLDSLVPEAAILLSSFRDDNITVR
jgi:hypothetical protein